MAAEMIFSIYKQLLLFCMLNVLLINRGIAHQKIIVDGGSKQITGLINRMIPIDVKSSVSMIHAASTLIPQDSKYIAVQPATVYPSPQKLSIQNYLTLPTNAVNLLDQLRTYQSSHYKDIVVFQQYIYLHLLPDKIVIVKQNQGAKVFQIINTYQLKELTVRSQTKMYKIKNGKQSQVLLIVSDSNVFYKLGLTQTKKFTLPNKYFISHLQFITDNIFVTAENGNGIKFYKIQKDQIKIIQRYSCQNLSLALRHKNKQRQQKKIQDIVNTEQNENNICKISDLYFNTTSSILYILNTKTGIHSSIVNINNLNQNKQQILQKLDVIIQAKDCDSFDLVSSQHYVLMCLIGMPNSYIQQIIKFPDPLLRGETIFVKKDPIYTNCNLKDLVVNDQFFLIFDSFSIDIFWNSMKSGSLYELSTEHTKQHFNIPGFQVFALKKPKDNIIYLVDSNILYKYVLNIFEGSISAYSPIPINKQIKIQIPGKCIGPNYQTLTTNKQINKNNQCFYEIKVMLNILQKIQPISQQKVSMSLGAIILMLTVMLILTWICLVKYKGLQKHARKILERHHQKSRYNDNRFTI